MEAWPAAAAPGATLQQRLQAYARRAATGIQGEGYEAVHVAAACGDQEAVRVLLEGGLQPPQPQPQPQQDKGVARSAGPAEPPAACLRERMREYGELAASALASTGEQLDAAHVAAARGDREAVRALLEGG